MPHFPKPFFRKNRKLWYVQLDGKQINLGADRDEAFCQYHKLMALPKHSPLPLSTCVLVVELADQFLDWVRGNRSPATFEWYRFRLQQFATKYPSLLLAELRPYHVEQWARELGGTVTTRRNRMRSVKRCLRWSKRQGHIDTDPIETLEVPNGQAKETYVSPEKFAKLLSDVMDDQFASLLTVTYRTGCRPQESLRVEARHVDLEQSRWVFPRSESKGQMIPRVVYLTGEALEISKRLVEIHPSGPLFRNQRGQPWTKDSVGCVFDRLCIRKAVNVWKELAGNRRMAKSNCLPSRLISTVQRKERYFPSRPLNYDPKLSVSSFSASLVN